MDNQEQLLSQEFQHILLSSIPANSTTLPSDVDRLKSDRMKIQSDGTNSFDDVFDLDPQSFDKWVPFLRSSIEKEELNAVIDELEVSVDDNFQGLELQLLQDSQINDKLESSIGEVSHIQSAIEGELLREIQDFQEKLTHSTNELITKKQVYVNNKKTSLKISEATILLTKVTSILELSNKCQQLITDRKFFKALQNLDNLEKLYLQEFKDYNFDFLRDIYESVPFLKSVIKDECINLIRNSFNSNLGKNLSNIGDQIFVAYSQELLPKWLEKMNLMKLNDFKFNSPVEISMRDQSIMEGLTLDRFFDLDEFYDAILIFQSLNEMDYLFVEFSKEYEFRKAKLIHPLVWKKTTSSSVNVLPGDISMDTFTKQMSLDFLKEYLLKILGFLLYDINLQKSTDFILVNNNYNSTNEFWDGFMNRLHPYLKHFLQNNLNSEDDLIKFKDFLSIYVAILENYRLNITPLYEVLVSVFEIYCNVNVNSIEKEFDVLLNDDDFMPLTIDDRQLYEKVLKICWMKDDSVLQNNDNDDSSFSVTLPFSPLYPMTCTLATKTYTKLTTFVSLFYRHDLHKLSKILIDTMDYIFNKIVNDKIRKKLDSTSREEISQILINLDYFIIAAKEFSNYMARENILQNPDIEIRLAAIKQYEESRKLAETKLIELIDTKISDILETVDIDWQSNDIRQEPDFSIIDVAQFLEMMFASTLVNLPYSVQTLLIFREFDSLTRKVLDILLHETPDHISQASVHNFGIDIQYLQGIIPKIFPNAKVSNPSTNANIHNDMQSPLTPSTPTFNNHSTNISVNSSSLIENNIKSLEETFTELNQSIDLLKTNSITDYMDPEIRMRKYSRLKSEDAHLLLSKVSVPARANSSIGDDDNGSIFNRELSIDGTNRIANFFNRR